MAASQVSAQDEPERQNCPAGFVWIRMSGTGCVQEDVPPNGRISYVGDSICNDGFVGIYEQRPTTDGKGVPGNPQATSFAYLLECVTPAEFAARGSRVEGTATLGDAASRLADDGAQLPPGELILLGALGSGALIYAAFPATRRRPSATAGPPSRGHEPAGPEPPDQTDPTDRELDAGELRRRIEALDRIDQDLQRQMDHYRQAADAGRLTPQDVVTWTGILANTAGLIPGAQLPAGIVSLAADLGAMIGQEYDTRDLDRAIREGLGAMAGLRGMLEVERAGYQAALAEAERPREPEVPPVAPELLPDDVLEAERAAAHQRTMAASTRAVDLAGELGRTGDKLREVERRIDVLTDHLPDLDSSPLRDGATDAAVWVDLAAGIDSMARSHQAQRLLQSAGQAQPLDAALELLDGIRGARSAGNVAGGISIASAGASMAEWFHARSVEEQRVILERAIEAMRYDAGRLQAQYRQLEAACEQASAQAEAEAARRKSLWNEQFERKLRRDLR